MQASSVDAAMGKHDAVLCALGTMPVGKAELPRRQRGTPVCSVGTKHILKAMANSGCRRIVVASSVAVGDSKHTGAFGAGSVVRALLRDVNKRGAMLAPLSVHSTGWLFDRNRLRQIARLIHVGAALDGDIIRHQLQWHRRQNRHQQIHRFRNPEFVVQQAT